MQYMTAEAVRDHVNRRMSEKAYQWRVVEMAVRLDWKHYHTHDSRRSPGGFPDLVLVRDRVVFAEIKAEKGSLSVMQMIWQDILKHAGQECYVWRPSDWETVCEVLA
jgi:hypothetical protein